MSDNWEMTADLDQISVTDAAEAIKKLRALVLYERGGTLNETAKAFKAEMNRARAKHKTVNFHALIEEVGEVSRGVLEGDPDEKIKAELLQVAVVAIRLYQEGGYK